jgi:hypothetical protein
MLERLPDLAEMAERARKARAERLDALELQAQARLVEDRIRERFADGQVTIAMSSRMRPELRAALVAKGYTVPADAFVPPLHDLVAVAPYPHYTISWPLASDEL